MRLTKDKLLEMYRQMVTIRLFEETIRHYYEKGNVVGTGHPSFGEEAVAVGACSALGEEDYLISNHRAHGHLLAKGVSLRVMMAELFAKATGCTGGKGGSMHLSDFDRHVLGTNGIVGGGITIAGGVGLAIKMRGTNQVCLCFFGDGASNRGVFHETLNLASLKKVPTIFVCCNNQYALSLPQSKGCANSDISARALAYNMPGFRVDGTDVIAVYESVKAAGDRARKGGGPSLIECVAYLLRGHSLRMDTMPGGSDYRPKGEMDDWAKNKDPIKIFKQKLVKLGYITDEITGRIDTAVEQEISEAVDFAMKSSEPGAETLFQNIYA
jgi:TPP-dependent pyruvate/acetoin dehydrogenase alpha subunit